MFCTLTETGMAKNRKIRYRNYDEKIMKLKYILLFFGQLSMESLSSPWLRIWNQLLQFIHQKTMETVSLMNFIGSGHL